MLLITRETKRYTIKLYAKKHEPIENYYDCTCVICLNRKKKDKTIAHIHKQLIYTTDTCSEIHIDIANLKKVRILFINNTFV